MNAGTLCELWEINALTGNQLLAQIIVLDEQMPLELFYRLTVTYAGICIHGRPAQWIWASQRMEVLVTNHLLTIQRTREEIRIEVCRPVPILPGYPHIDYHPSDFYECDLAVGLEQAEDVTAE